MHLPRDREALLQLNFVGLREAIIERRQIIREHRDAKGDHRCWLDDWLIWDMLDGHPSGRFARPPYDAMMKQCQDFYKNRNATVADPMSLDAIIDQIYWDIDLISMSKEQMRDELVKIQEAIYNHLTIGDRSRTLDDDRALYAVLPEKLPADFRLPKEDDFLGEGKAPHAGCPAFWRSHTGCEGLGHNLHVWGPCKAK